MMDATMGRRRTGLTRAKRIEQLTLWLGLPLLLLLLSLTAGIVNYTPVRNQPMPAPVPAPNAAPAAPEADVPVSAPTIPLRPDRLVPIEQSGDVGQDLHLEAPTPVS